jgi:hypothetical protein
VWTEADIAIVLDDELNAGSVVTVRISCPVGHLVIMGEMRRFDRELALGGVHIQGETVGPNALGWARLRQVARAVAKKEMSMLSLLKARLGPPVRVMAESRVDSGSPARYMLRPDPGFAKSISAVWALVKRLVPLVVAKTAVERLLVREEVVIELPMLEDAALFEAELRDLGIRAVKEIAAAADG